MNAIYIKFHSATKIMPTRVIASMIDKNSITSETIRFHLVLPSIFRGEDVVMQAVQGILSQGYAHFKPNIGKLPNGDYCATLSEAGL